MSKITFLILCSILSVTLAQPTWYPENEAEIVKKCTEEHPITPEVQEDIKNFADNPTIHALALCRAKGVNVYTEDSGLNVERLATLFFKKGSMDCKKPLVQKCVDQHKDITNQGEMVYKTIKCIGDKEAEKKGTC